jgi:UDP-N-acetylglucosamine--N-acetylmuramyl-(pentapeptide) pyrophosphoryl-undecaprenol N-acetylglucosamine transferase
MKVLFSGGGTLGPVTPLLAVWDIVKDAHPEATAIWVGTKTGPEKVLVEEKEMLFFSIPSGKLRRYLSPLNLIDLGKLIGGFFASLRLLISERPDVCISAGGFTSVPVHFAAWLIGIPTWIHQQDVVVGLSNRIMAPLAKQVTTALESSTSQFSKKKTSWLGNPIRKDILTGSKERAIELFHLDSDLPVVFVTGGGTGSQRVNQLVVEAVQHLETHAQVIHLTGRERPQELVMRAVKHFDHYQIHQFFTDEMKDAYAAADVVISRGGFGTISEIAALDKPAILIPKPGHQEQNVQFLAKSNAIVVVDENTADGNFLAKKIRELVYSEKKMYQLGEAIGKLLPPAKDEKVLKVYEMLIK